jgi:hypothetical protein
MSKEESGKTIKMAGITTDLLVTLKVNGLNSKVTPFCRLNLKTRPDHLLPIRNVPHWQKQT